MYGAEVDKIAIEVFPFHPIFFLWGSYLTTIAADKEEEGVKTNED
jgi:hypothetical protein